MPGIVIGCLLVFIPLMGEYIVPSLLGGARSFMIGNLIGDEFISAHDLGFRLRPRDDGHPHPSGPDRHLLPSREALDVRGARSLMAVLAQRISVVPGLRFVTALQGSSSP